MRKNIIASYVDSMDRKQMAEDMTEAAIELGKFISTFHYTDLPVVVFLMQSYIQKILATNDEMNNILDVLNAMFGSVAIIAAVNNEGGIGNGV